MWHPGPLFFLLTCYEIGRQALEDSVDDVAKVWGLDGSHTPMGIVVRCMRIRDFGPRVDFGDAFTAATLADILAAE